MSKQSTRASSRRNVAPSDATEMSHPPKRASRKAAKGVAKAVAAVQGRDGRGATQKRESSRRLQRSQPSQAQGIRTAAAPAASVAEAAAASGGTIDTFSRGDMPAEDMGRGNITPTSHGQEIAPSSCGQEMAASSTHPSRGGVPVGLTPRSPQEVQAADSCT